MVAVARIFWQRVSASAFGGLILLLLTYLHRLLTYTTETDSNQPASPSLSPLQRAALTLYGTQLACAAASLLKLLSLKPTTFDHNQGTFGWMKLMSVSCQLVGLARYGLVVRHPSSLHRDTFYVHWLSVWLCVGAYGSAALASRPHHASTTTSQYSNGCDADLIRQREDS